MPVVVDADTRMVIAAAPPVPGITADAHAWRASGLIDYCQGVTVIGDGASPQLRVGRTAPQTPAPASSAGR